MPLDEILQVGRQFARLLGAASAQLVRHVFRDVPRPTLCRVESDDANGTAVLAVKQIRDDGFETGSFGVCEDCGGPIPLPRLRAVPWARHCLGCQTRDERR